MLDIDVAAMETESNVSRKEKVDALIASINKSRGYQDTELQTDKGQRKAKRDDSKVWINANKAYFHCVDQLALLPVIGRFLKRPEVRDALGKDGIDSVVAILNNTREKRQGLVEQLKALRTQHIEIAKKYPVRQKKYRKQDEMLDNMSVMEGYMGWAEGAMEAIALPCADIMAIIEEHGVNLDAITTSDTVAETPAVPRVRTRPPKTKRVKHKHTVSKRK